VIGAVLNVVLRGFEGLLLGCLLVSAVVVSYNPSHFTYYDPGVQDPWEYEVPTMDPWWKQGSKVTVWDEEARKEYNSIWYNTVFSALGYVAVFVFRVGPRSAWKNARTKLEWIEKNIEEENL